MPRPRRTRNPGGGRDARPRTASLRQNGSRMPPPGTLLTVAVPSALLSPAPPVSPALSPPPSDTLLPLLVTRGGASAAACRPWTDPARATPSPVAHEAEPSLPHRRCHEDVRRHTLAPAGGRTPPGPVRHRGRTSAETGTRRGGRRPRAAPAFPAPPHRRPLRLRPGHPWHGLPSLLVRLRVWNGIRPIRPGPIRTDPDRPGFLCAGMPAATPPYSGMMSGAPSRAASAVRSSGCRCDSRSASTRFS